MRRLVFLIVSLVGLSSCGDGASVSQNKAKLVQLCGSELNVPEGVCDCISDTAEEELTPDGIAFVVAALEKDDAKTTELRSKMPFDEMTKSAMFMATAPANCAVNSMQ